MAGTRTGDTSIILASTCLSRADLANYPVTGKSDWRGPTTTTGIAFSKNRTTIEDEARCLQNILVHSTRLSFAMSSFRKYDRDWGCTSAQLNSLTPVRLLTVFRGMCTSCRLTEFAQVGFLNGTHAELQTYNARAESV